MKDVLKSIIVWIMIIPIAILNGGLREKVLIPQFGETIKTLLKRKIASYLTNK